MTKIANKKKISKFTKFKLIKLFLTILTFCTHHDDLLHCMKFLCHEILNKVQTNYFLNCYEQMHIANNSVQFSR